MEYIRVESRWMEAMSLLKQAGTDAAVCLCRGSECGCVNRLRDCMSACADSGM